jgi:hypothetical protein
MIDRRRMLTTVIALCGLSSVGLIGPPTQTRANSLPKQLSDRAFWQMIVDFSEPGGLFRSDNFLSNEAAYQDVIPGLLKHRAADGVYLGVGPDQNFTYITALRPRMVFIIDIRRQNLIEHLLYKAVIEMSHDRVEFLSRLFSRPRPAGLDRSSPLPVLFEAFSNVSANDEVFQENLQEIEKRLIRRHGFQLTAEDRQTLAYVYRAFFSEGPDLRYSFPRRNIAAAWFPSYAQLMLATDAAGLSHSYLATEENFAILREFEQNNLLIPIVGDFGGDKAIRAISRYLFEHGATVSYFYTSNVEQYLFQSDAWQHYYSNVATLPLNGNSTFIRAYFDSGFLYPPGIITPDLHSVQLVDPIVNLLNAVQAGQIHSYEDVVGR